MSETPFTFFFGSSTESAPFMETVASWIEPLPRAKLLLWNSPEAFPASQFTLQRLLDLTKMVGAAIFIFGEDDKIWYRESEALRPRDNVLLEYGLFASRLGIRNSLICRVAQSKLSSDLLGLTTINFKTGGMPDGKARLLLWAKAAFENGASEPTDPSILPICEHVARYLLPKELQENLRPLPHWKVINKYDQTSQTVQQLLTRDYEFPSFSEALQFMNSAVAEIDRLNHHPEWKNVWTKVTVLTTTWGVGHRITNLDFQLAHLLDGLFNTRTQIASTE